MTYAEQGEIVITQAEALLLRRLLLLIPFEQLERLAEEYEQLLARSDYGELALVIKARRLRYIRPSPSMPID